MSKTPKSSFSLQNSSFFSNLNFVLGWVSHTRNLESHLHECNNVGGVFITTYENTAQCIPRDCYSEENRYDRVVALDLVRSWYHYGPLPICSFIEHLVVSLGVRDDLPQGHCFTDICRQGCFHRGCDANVAERWARGEREIRLLYLETHHYKSIEDTYLMQELTSWSDIELDFAIVGVGHSGTSALVSGLQRHPQVQFTTCASRSARWPWIQPQESQFGKAFATKTLMVQQGIQKKYLAENITSFEPIEDFFFHNMFGLPTKTQVHYYNSGENHDRSMFETFVSKGVPQEVWHPHQEGVIRGLKQVNYLDQAQNLAALAAVKTDMKILVSVRDPLALFEWLQKKIM